MGRKGEEMTQVKMSMNGRDPSFKTRTRRIRVRWTVCEKMTERVEVVREPEDDSLFIMNR